ncbi:hypothetical protein Pfo_010068 [Paulownia fortunei]|nr:hypothetical protein Pfo_010068 [Paulownia fortunei]
MGSPDSKNKPCDETFIKATDLFDSALFLADESEGAGLENLGNTCYLNAVLQCFIHTVPFVHGILSDTHSVQCNCNKEGFCLLCALHELVKLSFTSRNRVISPLKLVNNLSYFSSSFQRSQQEDAHEFLQCFLNRLESCYDSTGKDYVSSQSDNFVKQVCGGRLVSKLKCCNCGYCSDTYEHSVDLSLEIEDADNLLTALQSFTKVEKIEDPEAKFTCEECREQVSIQKQLAFDQVPSVATFHLKRFKIDGCLVQKIDKHVAFPLELDLLPFTDRGKMSDVELKYVLYAIVVHIGLTFSSGHYYCFIRLSSNKWCKFDDSEVVRVHEDLVLSQEAYILFYAKEGTTWFSSFIETQKLCGESTISDTSPISVLHIDPSLSSPILREIFCCDSNEASDATGSKDSGVDNFNIKDGGSRLNKLESNETEDTLIDRISCKRLLEKDLDDLETREACSFIKKSTPGSTEQPLLAEQKGSQIEGSVSRKKSRFAMSQSRDDSSAPTDDSSIIAPALHPWIARTFRNS